MSFANAWGSAWGSSGSGQTIIIDSFGLEVSMEDTIFEEPQEFYIIMDTQELLIEQEESIIVSENQEFILELEVE